MPAVDFAHANRDVHGNRMRGARFLLVGGNDPDILGELADDLFQQQDASRVDAVIVDDEDAVV